jgi:hypothetical protein
VQWDFDFGKGATTRARETAERQRKRIRALAYKKLARAEATAVRAAENERRKQAREEKEAQREQEKKARADEAARKKRRKELEKPKVQREDRRPQRLIIAGMTKARLKYLEVREFREEFENEERGDGGGGGDGDSDDSEDEDCASGRGSRNRKRRKTAGKNRAGKAVKKPSSKRGAAKAAKRAAAAVKAAKAAQTPLPPIPRPRPGCDFSGTVFHGRDDEVGDLMSFWSSLQVYKGCLEDYADGFEVMQACFPPALTPIMLARVMEESGPAFSTASTARFYKEPGITSVFDKLMVSLVRIAFREMLHRLATADAENPMVPNWEMRYTARSSMYWFLKGSECINDISWPEYARRLLTALDREREGTHVEDIVRSLRGQTSSSDAWNKKVSRQEFMAPTRDSAYLPPEGSSGAVLLLDSPMTPWLRARCLFLIEYLARLPDADVFLKPVNPEEFPSYSDEVADPMDLGTVRNYLLAGEDSSRETDYKTVGDFAYDVRLVWSNCAQFNSPDSAITTVSEIMSMHFERALKLWVLRCNPAVTLNYGGPLEMFRAIMRRPWKVGEVAAAPRHPACHGLSVPSTFGPQSMNRYDIKECYDATRRNPVFFGRSPENPAKMHALLDTGTNMIVGDQSTKWMVENNIASDSDDATLQQLLRALETTERCDLGPVTRLRLSCFFMELVSDGDIAREHLSNQLERQRELENTFDKRDAGALMFTKRPWPDLSNVPGKVDYEILEFTEDNDEDKVGTKRKGRGQSSSKKGKAKGAKTKRGRSKKETTGKAGFQNCANIDWEFYDKVVLGENGVLPPTDAELEAAQAAASAELGCNKIAKSFQKKQLTQNTEAVAHAKAPRGVTAKVSTGDDLPMPKTCALCGLLAQDLAEKFVDVCWYADPTERTFVAATLNQESASSGGTSASSMKKSAKKSKSFVECPLCCPGSGKEEGHKGRHRLHLPSAAKLLRDAKAAEAKAGGPRRPPEMPPGLEIAVYPQNGDLDGIAHNMMCVHKSCAKALRKGRKVVVKHHKRQYLRKSLTRRFAADAAALRRECVHVTPLGRDNDNAVYYIFGGDRTRLYVARPGSTVSRSPLRSKTPPAAKSTSKIVSSSATAKKGMAHEKSAMTWSWYGSRAEIRALIDALKARSIVLAGGRKRGAYKLDNVDDGQNIHGYDPEPDLLRALEAELTIWDKPVAATVEEERTALVMRNRRVEDVVIATTKDEFECFLSRRNYPELKFTIASSAYLLLPRLYVVFKCIRDAVFYCQSQEKQDEALTSLAPLQLLPYPVPPAVPKKRRPTKQDYIAFQMAQTGITEVPQWPPVPAIRMEHTINLMEGRLGLELKGSDLVDDAPLHIVDIHEGGAAARSCPELRRDVNLIMVGGADLQMMPFTAAVAEVVKMTEKSKGGKLDIVVERDWEDRFGMECPPWMAKEKFDVYRKAFDTKYVGWSEAKLRLDAQVEQRFRDDERAYAAALPIYEKKRVAVEQANQELLAQRADEERRILEERRQRVSEEREALIRNIELEKLRADLMLFGHTLPSDVFLSPTAHDAPTGRVDNPGMTSPLDLYVPPPPHASLSADTSVAAAAAVDPYALTPTRSTVGQQQQKIWMNLVEKAASAAELMKLLLELEKLLGSTKSQFLGGHGIAMRPGVVETNFVMCPMWPNPVPAELLARPTCAAIAARLYPLEYAVAYLFSADGGQSLKNLRRGIQVVSGPRFESKKPDQ